jgi:hypothetical protein
MKRCPECYEVYDNEVRFCETDGHELLADPAYSPKPEVVVVNPSADRSAWWPAAAFGILIGIIVGAGVFAVAMLVSTPEANEHPARSQATEVREKALPNRATATSNPAPTPEPEESPSPDSEEQAEAEPSPATNTETRTASVQLNQGPISTGQKTKAGEVESTVQTVIEMNDGSTLAVEAAWEDKQGIWYRRSGLVSFVDSSRVKAITSRREAKVAEAPHR